jgi:uncharacterized metal-binding protein
MTNNLYNDDDIKVMEITRNSVNRSRLQELITFLKNSNYKRIGIANCFSMQKYANNLKKILEENNFQVFDINCKTSGLTTNDLFKDDSKGLSCDPVSQAKYLNDNNTEFNINVGLCLGHGIVFNKYSDAPVTTLIVKDFSTKHKTVEELED